MEHAPHNRLVPLEPADHEVLSLRNNLRDLLALLDMEKVQVTIEHIDGRSALAIAPLPLDMAIRLIRVLDTHPDARNEGLALGSLVWDPRHHLVGEVVASNLTRVKLCGLADGSTWMARPSEVVPPRLTDINTALNKAAQS